MGSFLLVTTAIARALVQHLDGEIEERAQAAAELVKLGEWAWPAIAESAEPEVAAVRTAIARTRIRIEIDGTYDAFRVTFRNGSFEDIRIHPAGLKWEVWLLEVFRDPPKLAKRIYGSGEYRTGESCLLRDSDFMLLKSGESWSQTIDARQSRGLKFAPELEEKYPWIALHAPGFPGRYRFVATYRFDAAEYKSKCGKGCAEHDQDDKPWNRCESAPRKAESEFEIRD